MGCSGNGALAALTSPQFSVQGCSVETALEAASLHPAQLLGIEHKKGTLNYDSDAGTGVGTACTGMETMVSGLTSAGAAVSTCLSPVSVGAAGRLAPPGICSGLLLQCFFPWWYLGNLLECPPHLS